MTEMSVDEAIAMLNSNGIQTEIEVVNGPLTYMKSFIDGSVLFGSIEIEKDGNWIDVPVSRINNILERAATMKIESEASVLAQSVGVLARSMYSMIEMCHNASYDAGWWHHPKSGIPYIPGDDARISMEDGTVGTVAWAQLPELIRDMVIHYWPIYLGCKMALVHSEISEGLEAIRKGLMDDKLKHRTGIEAELSDAMIREFDLTGGLRRAASLGIVDPKTHGSELPMVLMEKIGFNANRPDHKIAARVSSGGKYF